MFVVVVVVLAAAAFEIFALNYRVYYEEEK
jgi:hypothetical protein